MRKLPINIFLITSTGASSVRVYYSKSTSFEKINEIKTSLQTSTHTVDLSGLEDGSRYFYKVNPIDSDGFEYQGTILEFMTPPLPRILNVKVQEVKNVAQPSVEVIWESNTEISSIIEYTDTKSNEKKSQVDLVSTKTTCQKLQICGKIYRYGNSQKSTCQKNTWQQKSGDGA